MAINRRDIFISYSHDDVAFLDQLKEDLRLHSISPWMDGSSRVILIGTRPSVKPSRRRGWSC